MTMFDKVSTPNQSDLEMLAAMLEGNRPPIGTEIPANVGRMITRLDYLTGLREIGSVLTPKKVIFVGRFD